MNVIWADMRFSSDLVYIQPVYRFSSQTFFYKFFPFFRKKKKSQKSGVTA